MLALIACLSPWVIDGDSLRCRGRGGFVGEVRLLGIDTPDRTSSRPCREHFGNHVCDNAGAKRAKDMLIRIVAANRRSVRLEPVTRDRYGRMVAEVWAGSTNLSCWQLERRVARYIVKYDDGHRIARACRIAK